MYIFKQLHTESKHVNTDKLQCTLVYVNV